MRYTAKFFSLVVTFSVAFTAWFIARAVLVPEYKVPRYPAVAVEIADPEKAVARFAGLLRFRTVSQSEAENHAREPKEFVGLHRYLRKTYPLIFKELEVQQVNEYSLLIRWPGTDPTLKPGLCVSHLDVVDVGDEKDWAHSPFSGKIADGFVWGRGALDLKITTAALLEATSMQLKRKKSPRRTLYLAFGHDEEVMGELGAGRIAKLLHDSGVELEFISDEGGTILVDGIKGITDRAVAVIGTAEKALQLYKVEINGHGGHSMVPPIDGSSVVSRLASFMYKLEQLLPRPRITPPTAGLLKSLGSATKNKLLGALLGSCDVWPLSIAVGYIMSHIDSDMSACVRSTAVVTDIAVLPLGTNVIPSYAEAYINFRLLPGEAPDYAQALLNEAASGVQEGGAVNITFIRGTPSSPTASLRSPGFKALQKAAIETLHYPQGLVIAPYLMLGGTDSRQYTRLGLVKDVFRFAPFPTNRTAGDLKRVHGINERVSTEAYLQNVKFFVRFLEHAFW